MLKRLSSSYYTNYSATGDFELKFDRDCKNTACFAESFRKLGQRENVSERYQIYIYKVDGGDPHAEKGNATFLTKEELHSFIGCVKNVFPFSYRINETNGYYLIDLKVSGPSINHKFILTWIRYTYEYPFNVCCLYTMDMRKNPKYKYINTINLMHSIAIHHCYMGGHSIIGTFRNPVFYTYGKLAQRLKGKESLHKIHDNGDYDLPRSKSVSYSPDREQQLKGRNVKNHTYVKYYKKCKQ